MRIKPAGIIVQTLVMLLFCISASGQVQVERSKDKVVISGVTYYIHQVKKGETTYSISKAYNVTVEELTKENPPALYGIKEGQTLRIPFRAEQVQAPSQPQPLKHDDTRYIYHVLKPRETIYYLSRTYGVTENDIIQSNPGLDISKISIGTEVAVPKKEFLAARQDFKEPVNVPVQNQPASSSGEKGYILHKVQNGESLSSIADIYGVSVRELRKANRDLRFPQVGDFVRVPGVAEPEKLVVVQPVKDTVVHVTEEPVPEPVKPSGFTRIDRLSGSLNVAVLLPFYLYENSLRYETDSAKVAKGKKTYKSIRREDDWIYPGSLDFIEMYQGILLAADTLRALGLNINIHTYDVRDDTSGLVRLLNTGRLDNMNLIIGPVYSRNLALAARFGSERGIPVVSPVPLYDNSVLAGNPDLFLASSTLGVAQQKIAEKLKDYSRSNIIFVHADSLGINPEVKRYRQEIMTQLSSVSNYEDIRFREFLFYSRSMFSNDSINRLEHAMSSASPNVVVIASEYKPLISETMIEIHSLSRLYDVKTFCYPVLRDVDNLDPKYFYDLGLELYTPYWIDYSKSDIRRFNAVFRQKFLTEPTESSYAWQGYDIAYYFLSGLALHGNQFVRNPSVHRPDLLESDFDFRQDSSSDGFENHNLFLMRYTKDYELQLVNDPGQ